MLIADESVTFLVLHTVVKSHASAHVRKLGFPENFACGMILGFGIWNAAQGILNPAKTGIQNPSSSVKGWNPVPRISVYCQ